MRLALRLGFLLSALGAPSPAQAPRFEAGVTNVHVQVSMTQDGRVISGLRPSDFVVGDEGEAQTIVAFGQESVPIRLILLLDMSGSMRRDIRELASIAGAVLKQVQPRDQVGVMSFTVEGHLETALSSDMNSVAATIKRVAAQGVLGTGTRLIPAISSALRILSVQSPEERPGDMLERKAILIITDNLPGPARTDNPDVYFQPIPDTGVIRDLLEADTVLNAIVVHRQHIGRRLPPPRNNPDDPRYTQENAFHIAEATGGDALISARMKDSFPEMLARIRLRYSIWYRPPQAKAGTYRRISVSLSDEALRRYPKATVRARAGYYAQ